MIRNNMLSVKTVALGKRPLLAALMVACFASLGLSDGRAQEFPAFPGFVNTAEYGAITEGLSILQAPNGYYSNYMLLTYIHNGYLNVGGSLDGKHYTIGGGSPVDPTGGNRIYQVNCEADLKDICSTSSILFQGKIFVAEAGSGDKGLDVIRLDPVQGQAYYTATLVHHDPNVQLTSAPAMAIGADGGLIIRFGTSNNSSLKNATYNTKTTDGINFTAAYPSGGLAPTQSSIVLFKGQLYSIDKQDNSDNGVFVSKLDSNGSYINGTAVQIPNWTTQYGFSAVVYNSNIVVAFQGNSSSHYFYIFSSPDAVNWYAQGYPNRENFTPKLALYQTGISAATIANDSSYTLWTDFAPY